MVFELKILAGICLITFRQENLNVTVVLPGVVKHSNNQIQLNVF